MYEPKKIMCLKSFAFIVWLVSKMIWWLRGLCVYSKNTNFFLNVCGETEFVGLGASALLHVLSPESFTICVTIGASMKDCIYASSQLCVCVCVCSHISYMQFSQQARYLNQELDL